MNRASMLLALASGALLFATPAAAEHIRAYWQLESAEQGGSTAIAFGTTFLEQRILPVRLVRLNEAAIPAGASEALPAGTLLYLVVNDAGQSGFCTIKDRKNAAKTLFVPALDRRPCFVDRDGDGRFDASFGVFDAYAQLSPPQPRGNLSEAQPIARPARYEQVDPHLFPDRMTFSFRLTGSSERIDRIRLEVTLDRPGHRELVDVRGRDTPLGRVVDALGTVVLLKSIAADHVEAELHLSPNSYVYGEDNGTGFVRELPAFMR